MSRLSALKPPVELSPNQVDALNAVDLQLYFGNHGYPSAIIGHGAVELALKDSDYAGLEPMIASFNPQRGDIFVRESCGYESDWDHDAELAALLDWHLADSPYLSDKDRRSLRLLPENPAFVDALEKMRAFQLIGPITYASLLADVKGIPCHYADFSLSQETVWQEKAEELVTSYPKPVQRALFYHVGDWLMLRARDGQTISGLGSIAMTMERQTSDVPVLNYVGGAAHRANIEQVLAEYKVKHTSHAFSPKRKSYRSPITWRDIAHLTTFKGVDSTLFTSKNCG